MSGKILPKAIVGAGLLGLLLFSYSLLAKSNIKDLNAGVGWASLEVKQG